MDMYVNASAMNAFGSGMQTIAHNIANVSTRDFEPQSYHYESGPLDQGVRYVQHENAPVDRPVNPPASPVDRPLRPEVPPDVNFRDDYLFNGVDLPREFVNMITTQRAFEANARVISTVEETSGVILDIVV